MSASADVASPTLPLSLTPIAPPALTPRLPASGAVWVGQVGEEQLWAAGDGVELVGGAGFTRARLLVRAPDGRPHGFVELPVVGGRLESWSLRRAASQLPRTRSAATSTYRGAVPSVSVVVCSYDRPSLLQAALTTLLALGDEVSEVVVVDNHPASGLTRPVVAGISDPRLRYVTEPAPGLARARNSGALAATGDVLAFTDDDTLVDRQWVSRLREAFRLADDVDCVTGLVPSAELLTSAQVFFDDRVQWAANYAPEIFRANAPPPDEPLFPFRVRRFGTGANFAVRRSVLFGLGGFDERLGTGSPSGGGEDIDLFVRVLLSGSALVHEPAAIVWHRHRSELADLERQIRDYGRGLGAWMTTLAMRPGAWPLVVRRARPGLAHLRGLTRGQAPAAVPSTVAARLGAAERRAFTGGPLSLLRGGLQGRRARPLALRRTDSRGRTWRSASSATAPRTPLAPEDAS